MDAVCRYLAHMVHSRHDKRLDKTKERDWASAHATSASSEGWLDRDGDGDG